MLSRLAAMALLLSAVTPFVSSAATVAEIGPPRNPPPGSFAGPQFVDSRGCVYMRAGYDGKVTWVPRLDSGKQVLCGYRPTAVPGRAVVAVAPAPRAARPSVPTAPPAPPAAVRTASAASPALVVAIPPGPAIRPPKGYVSAWHDGRLNPMRGPRSAAGDAQMRRVWTQSVPMRLKPQPDPDAVASTTAPQARLSTSNGPPVRSEAGRFVQVGSFEAPANAQRAVARLLAAGLPVAMARAGALQVVLAGPFGDDAATGAALAVARGAGFRDAFARN